MYARVLTSCLYGLSGEPTWVETDVDNGLPGFFMVGLADQAIREAKERIRSAIRSGGHKFPDKRITVNLTPANKKKEGSHFDLPIAIGVLLASESVLCRGDLSKTAFLGELTLDGRVQPCEGVLPMVIGLQRRGIGRVVLPQVGEQPWVRERGAAYHYGVHPRLGHLLRCGDVVNAAVPDDAYLRALDDLGEEVVVHWAAVHLRSEAPVNDERGAACSLGGVEKLAGEHGVRPGPGARLQGDWQRRRLSNGA